MPGTINKSTVVPPGFIPSVIPIQTSTLTPREPVRAFSANRFSASVTGESQNDDNGITGPDWGHSEVVFNCFPKRCFQHNDAYTPRHLSLLHSAIYSSLQRVLILLIDCSPKQTICKVLFIFRSNVCTSYRFRMDMARYGQPSYQLQQYLTSSVLSKEPSVFLCQRCHPTLEVHKAILH